MIRHPLAIGLILLIQTLATALITGIITSTFWFSYILFLVFLGGILVLFIYVTSLASNEIFSVSTSRVLILSSIMLLRIVVLLFWDSFLNTTWINPLESTFFLSNPLSVSLAKLYTHPTSILTLTLVVYLLLTLIVVVKITNVQEGPLRQIN
jgi:NADH-ubiquinone oxidoreductase chain 6